MSTLKTGGYVDPTWPSPMGPNDALIVIYRYIPSQALSILGIVLFALALLVHSGQVLLYRFWSFTPVAIACLMEIIGYAFRFLSGRNDPYNIIYFVVEYFFIVTAPVLISASIYICLTKLIRWAGTVKPNASRLNPKIVLWVFITADVVTTIMQITGAALIGAKTSKHKDPTAANDILLAGLAIQSFCFVLFLGLYARFIFDLVKSGLVRQKLPFIVALAASSLLVFLRTIFRLGETSQGVFGYLRSHERFFGCLEFAPIALAVGVLATWHPARYVLESNSSQGLEEGKP